MSKYLIVGLGNIGAEYAHTRHNIGFDVADALAEKQGGVFIPERLADVATWRWKSKTVVCIKPTTYMNLSGRAVKYWMDKEAIAMENILVIVDDLALPLDKIRLRPSGSDAGHNGLRSIQEALHTDKYPKLRFGIGNQFPKGRQADFVLSSWNKEEAPLVDKKIGICVEIIEHYMAIGIDFTMSKFNKLVISL